MKKLLWAISFVFLLGACEKKTSLSLLASDASGLWKFTYLTSGESMEFTIDGDTIEYDGRAFNKMGIDNPFANVVAIFIAEDFSAPGKKTVHWLYDDVADHIESSIVLRIEGDVMFLGDEGSTVEKFSLERL